MIDLDPSLTVPEAKFVATTTARELTGSDRDDTYDLLDSPLHVFRSDHDGATELELIIERPPFDSEEFIDFLNHACPSKNKQSPYGIIADWAIALEGDSRLAMLHARLENDWPIFVDNAEAFCALSRAAQGNEFPTYGKFPYERYESWLASIPQPVPVEKVKKDALDGLAKRKQRQVDALTIDSEDTALTPIELEAMQALVPLPTKLFVKRMRQLGAPCVEEALADLIRIATNKTTAKYRHQDPGKIIRDFAKQPHERRIVVHTALLSLLNSDPIRAEKLYAEQRDKAIKEHIRCNKMLRVIDADGQPGYVAERDIPLEIRDIGVPDDYRSLRSVGLTVTDRGGNFRKKSLQVTVANTYSGGWIREFIQIIERVRDVAIEPSIRVRVPKYGSNSSFSFDQDKRTIHIDGVERVIHRSGLFGLIVVNFLTDSVRSVMPRQRGLPEHKGRLQDMGAAQLPLLAIMYRRRLLGGEFVRAARQLAGIPDEPKPVPR